MSNSNFTLKWVELEFDMSYSYSKSDIAKTKTLISQEK